MSAPDPRIVQLSELALRLFPGATFVIAIAGDEYGFQSMANASTEIQVEILRALLRSFEAGTAVQTDVVEVKR